MSFNARAAKSLPAGEHIIFSEYPGLRLKATVTTRTWVYRYKSPVDGKMRQTAIGHWPAMSFHAAVAEWEKLKADRENGVDRSLSAKQSRAKSKPKSIANESVYTVALLCRDYVDGHIKHHRSEKGIKEASRMFNTMLLELGDMPATDITRPLAFGLIQRYQSTAPVQASKLRCELGAAWDYAIDAGKLSETTVNWWRLILKGKIRSKGKFISGERVGTVKRVLSDEELSLLIKWLPNFSPAVADVLTLYLWTACRGGEIVSMTGREITEKDGITWWTIPKHKTKNARHVNASDQRVPLFGRGLDVVIRRKQNHGNSFLFPNQSGSHIKQKFISEQVYIRQPYRAFRPNIIQDRLPVTHWAPHDLRRTSRTILASLGCPDAVGETILGHMLPGIVGTYNRYQYDIEKVEWLKRLSDYLLLLA